jgi:prephenate dehydrogenase
MQKPLTVGIIGGKGIMGQFFTRLFTKNKILVRITDKEREISLEELAKTCDAIMVSVPIHKTEKVIKEIGPLLTEKQCLFDITSLKESPLKTMLACTSAEVFGTHPMFASPPSDSLCGQIFVFCEGRGKKYRKIFQKIFEQEGASIIQAEAKAHDKMMSIVQGLSHFLDITFAKTLQKTGIAVESFFEMRSPAYTIKNFLMGRTLSQDASLYGSIQIENTKNTETISTFLEVADDLFSLIQKKDLNGFRKYFDEAKGYLGKFAETSREKSDEVLDFLARKNNDIHKKLPKRRKSPEKDSKNPKAVGILGPAETFSHLAFKAFCKLQKKNFSIRFFSSLPGIFTAYKKGEISSLFVPIENKIHGSVGDSLNGIVRIGIPIAAVFEMPINPVLMILKDSPQKTIAKIFSHSQPLSQCSDYLNTYFPEAELIATHSTVSAVERMIKTPHSAAIASEEVEKNFPVEIIARNIINEASNSTRFAFLSPFEQFSSEEAYEGAVIFSFAKDSPGTLAGVLQDFAKMGINLTKIESRPTGKGYGDYIFLIEYSGKLQEDTRNKLLESVKQKTEMLLHLGEFPVLQA